MFHLPPISTLFPYTTLFRSSGVHPRLRTCGAADAPALFRAGDPRLHLSAAPGRARGGAPSRALDHRSEEHTSELQSRRDLVCRLLLEKKKNSSNEKSIS